MGLLGAAGEDVGRPAAVLLTAGVAGSPGVQALARYAGRWGYELRLSPGPVGVRGRAALLRQSLRTWRLAAWLDADLQLPHQDEDVAGLLRPWTAQALAVTGECQDGGRRPDPGVWVVRSCPAAVAVLQAVERTGPAPLSASALQRSTTWLPGRWGQRCTPPAYADRPQVPVA